MKGKSGKSILVLFFVVLSLLLNLVSAYYSDAGNFLRQGSEQVIDGVVGFAEPFLQVLLGGQDYSSYFLFEKFLFFILLLSIIYMSLSKVPFFDGNEQKAVRWVISVIVPLIAVRFLDLVWLNTIIITYQILGIALTAILPFLLYLFFIHGVSDSKTVRKIAWIFFIVIYYFLWSTTDSDTYAEVYFWTMLLALIFLFLDGTIHKYFRTVGFDQAERDRMNIAISELDRQIREVETSALPQREKEKTLKNLFKSRAYWIKQLGKI